LLVPATRGSAIAEDHASVTHCMMQLDNITV